MNLDELRDGALRALAAAQRRVDEVEREKVALATLGRRCICDQNTRMSVYLEDQLKSVDDTIEAAMRWDVKRRRERAVEVSALAVDLPDAPRVGEPSAPNSTLLAEAFDRGAAAGLELGIALGTAREEEILERLRVVAAENAELRGEMEARTRAANAESAAARCHHGRAIEALRHERLDRQRIEEDREAALSAASAAFERLASLRAEVAAARAEEDAFARHARGLQEAMRAMAQRHAVALAQAIEASQVAARSARRERDARLIDEAVRRAFRSRRRDETDRASLDAALKAVDDLCEDLPSARRPRVSSQSQDAAAPPPERPQEKHAYLRRGAAKSRYEKLRRQNQVQAYGGGGSSSLSTLGDEDDGGSPPAL